MRCKFLLLGLLLTLFLTLPAHATTLTVKAGGGGSFSTIQACANAAVAGDTCEVFAGTYNETPSLKTSGSAGSPITFSVNPGDCVTVQGFNINSGVSYVVIGNPSGATCTTNGFAHPGFYVTGSPIQFSTASNITIEGNYISSVGSDCLSGPGTISQGTATYFYVLNNVLDTCGGTGNVGSAGGIGMEGNHWLVDGNTFQHVADGMYAYGSYLVIRNNHFGPINQAEEGSNHPDGIESTCGGPGQDYPLVHMLYEGNTTEQWRDTDGHGLLLRDINGCGQTMNILRFNQMVVLGSNFISNDGSGTTAGTKTFIYNNSVSNTQRDSSPEFSDLTFTQGGTGAVVINNIFQDDWTETPPYCIYVDDTSTSGFVENHNLCFYSGFSGTWQTGSQGAYSSTDVFNQDPKFVGATTDLHLQAGSPAIGAGGPLTTAVGLGANSTSLTVGNAALFSDGYGLTGVQADWIRIGASTTAQIASINYSSNVLTLATPVSWSSGDAVYLYKNSTGAVVLSGANPNIGFDQTAGSSGGGSSGGGSSQPPAPPTNVQAVAK